MAKPQLEHGRVEIALDLFVAIMTADFSNREMIVLSEAILQAYGPKKLRNLELIPGAIEVYSGLRRDNALRGIRALLDRNVIKENPGGTFRFNKDYESWTFHPDNQPFRKRLIRFANSAFERFQYLIEMSKKVVLPLEELSRQKLLPLEEHPPKTGGKLLQREEDSRESFSSGSTTNDHSVNASTHSEIHPNPYPDVTSGNIKVAPSNPQTPNSSSYSEYTVPSPLSYSPPRQSGGGGVSGRISRKPSIDEQIRIAQENLARKKQGG